MASWKKVIVSGSQAHLQGITASNLTNNTSTPPAQIVGYNPITGVLSYFDTSSIANPNAFVQGGNSFGTTATLGTNDANSLVLETNNTTRLFISSSGNIGIGTAIPANALEVSGGITATSLTASGAIIIGNGDIKLPVNGYIFGGDIEILNGNHVLYPANPPAQPNDILVGTSSFLASNTQIQLRSISEPNVIGGYDSGSIFFKTPSGSGMTYTNEGRLGIGVSNPTSTLHVSGANDQALFEIDSPAVNNIIYVSGSGNVGIGTATPTNTLQVGGTGISTTNLTASGLPQTAPDSRQVLMIDSASGAIVRVTAASLSGSVGVDSFKTVSVGGLGTGTGGTVTADSSTDTLNISSSDVNLTISASGTTIDTITFDFADSPIFTHITASGNISASGNLTVTGEAALGSDSGDQITLGGGVTDTVIVQGLFTLGDNLLNSNLIPTFGNSVVIGSSSKAIQSIVVNQITASGLPQTAPGSRQVLMIDSSTGAVVRVTAAELSGSVGVDSFRTISIGGVGGSGGPVVADSSTDTLNISSSDVNLTISASGTTIDTITFDFADSPIFTHITASGNISSSGNLTVTGNSTIGGTLGVTGLLSANGALTTTNLTASGNISSSGNLTVMGTSTLTGRLTANGAITTTNVTASGNISASGNIIVTGDIAVNGGDITTNQTSFNLLAGATGTLTIGAATTNVTIPGNLIVNGDTTILNTTELLVEDKFIILASGSIAGSPQDSGIIIQTTTGSSGIGSGSALFLNGNGVPSSGTSRWGLAQNIPHNATSVAPTDYIMSVSSSTADPTLAPTYGSASAGFGNVHINTQSKTIWMYI